MPLPEYAALAGRLGCDFVSVNFGGAANPLGKREIETLRESPSLRRDLVAAVGAHGLRLELVEGFGITPELSVERYATDLDAVALLGARSICAVSMDKDMGRTRAQIAILSEMAAERELAVTTEVGAGVMRNFEVALAAWREIMHPNFSLLIDTMHFFRGGAVAQDLLSVPPDAVGHVQLCDVPMPRQMESYLEEALFERRCPGDGDLPLASFLAHLPSGVPIGLEVPVRSEIQAGVAADVRLRRCVARTRSLLLEAKRP